MYRFCLLMLGFLLGSSSADAQIVSGRLDTDDDALFLKSDMPLTWSFKVYASDNYYPRIRDGTLDIVFLEPAALNAPPPNAIGFPEPEEIIGTPWLVLTMTGRRQYWFETLEGLFASFDTSTVGHLLFKRGLHVGDQWEWMPGNYRTVTAIRDTVLDGRTYASVVEIHEQDHTGEEHIYGWASGVGLVYYWSAFPNYRIRAVVMGASEHWLERTDGIRRRIPPIERDSRRKSS